jgi:hypothetical protein
VIARLMIMSIWYSPCLRIATAMIDGIPNSTMTGITTVQMASVTGLDSLPEAATASSAAAGQTAPATAASVIHLIC